MEVWGSLVCTIMSMSICCVVLVCTKSNRLVQALQMPPFRFGNQEYIGIVSHVIDEEVLPTPTLPTVSPERYPTTHLPSSPPPSPFPFSSMLANSAHRSRWTDTRQHNLLRMGIVLAPTVSSPSPGPLPNAPMPMWGPRRTYGCPAVGFLEVLHARMKVFH